MAVYNVELRRSNGSNYEDRIFIKTSVGLVEGLLDVNNKIKASLLPSFVFGSMRFVSTWDGSAKCSDCNGTGQISSSSTTCPTCNGTGQVGGFTCPECSGHGTIETLENCETCGGDGVIESDNNKLSAAKAMIERYVITYGGSLIGCYFIASKKITLDVSSPYVLHKEEQDTDSTTIESGDWLICMSGDGYTWGVINNTYQDASTTSKGVVKLATEQDGVNGTATTLAMTPKATVAAINARAYQHPTYTGNDLGAPLTGPKVISDVNVNSLGHVTGFATRNLTLADLGFTGDSNANYYVHPDITGMPLTLSLGPLEHISNIQIDKQGHITTASKVGIPTASESTTGVVTLASSSEAKGGTNNSKVLTPARAKEMIDKFASIPIVQSLPTNMSEHPAGKLILLQI